MVLPELGESVTEGTVTRWLKAVGDDVAVDEPLLEISTDKVDTEIPSPVAGTLQEILVQEDETVNVGAALARIGSGAAAPAQEEAPAAPAAEEKPAEQPAPAAEEKPAEQPAPAAEEKPAEQPLPPPRSRPRRLPPPRPTTTSPTSPPSCVASHSSRAST